MIDTDAMSDQDRRQAARVVLDLMAPSIESYECDVPWSQQQGWPDDVRVAAERLSSVRRPRRSENAEYRQTGIVERSDDAVWRAFVTFAPFAFDAGAWDGHGRKIVELTDEGTSFVVSLDETEARAASVLLGDEVVVPLKTRQRRGWRSRVLGRIGQRDR